MNKLNIQEDATAKNGLYDSGHVHTMHAWQNTAGWIDGLSYLKTTANSNGSVNISTGYANLKSNNTETRPYNYTFKLWKRVN